MNVRSDKDTCKHWITEAVSWSETCVLNRTTWQCNHEIKQFNWEHLNKFRIEIYKRK